MEYCAGPNATPTVTLCWLPVGVWLHFCLSRNPTHPPSRARVVTDETLYFYQVLEISEQDQDAHSFLRITNIELCVYYLVGHAGPLRFVPRKTFQYGYFTRPSKCQISYLLIQAFTNEIKILFSVILSIYSNDHQQWAALSTISH